MKGRERAWGWLKTNNFFSKKHLAPTRRLTSLNVKRKLEKKTVLQDCDQVDSASHNTEPKVGKIWWWSDQHSSQKMFPLALSAELDQRKSSCKNVHPDCVGWKDAEWAEQHSHTHTHASGGKKRKQGVNWIARKCRKKTVKANFRPREHSRNIWEDRRRT